MHLTPAMAGSNSMRCFLSSRAAQSTQPGQAVATPAAGAAAKALQAMVDTMIVQAGAMAARAVRLVDDRLLHQVDHLTLTDDRLQQCQSLRAT